MATQKKSDLSRAFSEDGALKTHVGGQALLEGVMMRGKFNWAVAVREPAGTVYTEEHDLASGRSKNSWLRLPIIRGCTAFVESLALGFKALEIAALHAFADEEVDAAVAGSAVLPNGGTADAAVESAGTGEPYAALGVGQSQLGAAAALPHSAASTSLTDVDRGQPLAGFGASASDALAEPAEGLAEPAGSKRPFSWKDDFGNPDTMIDALAAQRTLEVVCEPADEAAAGQPVQPAQDGDASAKSDEGEFGHREMMISMVAGLVLGVVLFIVAPAAITNLIVGEYDQHTLAWNLVDGVLRVAVFIGYIWLIGRMQDIKRMFGYHGAEHKTIHCYEHGLELTPENARSFPRLHVRCGTAFLIMVMIIAILVYTMTPLNALIGALGVPDGAPKLVLVIIVRILLMPVIAGIAYEITVKWAGSHPNNPIVKVVLWPGMQMQRLTTREPDDGQVECAIAAMKMVLEREQAEAAAGNFARAN